MTTTYVNNVYDVLLVTLQKLLRTEFEEKVSLEGFEDENGSFYIRPSSDEYESHAATSHVRRYQARIDFISKGTNLHQTKRAERLKRLIFNNANYTSGTLQWIDGRSASVDYEPEFESEDETIKMFELIFECVIHEAIS